MHHMHQRISFNWQKRENTAHPALIMAVVPSSFTHVAQTYSSRDVIIVPLWSTFLDGATPNSNPKFLHTWFSAIITHSRHLIWSMTLKAQALNFSKGNGTHICPKQAIQNHGNPDHEKKQTKTKLTKSLHFENSVCRWGLKKIILIIHPW